MKIIKKNQPKIVIFTAVKNRCLLHGRVFVMNIEEVPQNIVNVIKHNLNPIQ